MDRSASDSLDYSGDGAAGSFFSTDFKRHDDLKQMLDSNRDNLKLEAMKRIIGMVAKGRDASDLFPAVVKNVVSKNPEVKKLVYVYLVRYAEEQQDCALLSISTFQRALKDPNQLIRASALRVLSSIRVPMIVPIVMLAIRDAAADMSPYVRKTAAHAIPKLYSLDPEQKEELVTVLDKLLADRTTLVVGSAVMAFEEVCPERIDLIHKNYRKLCALLMDVDEWGQVVIINMLTRYARTQFLDPNTGDMTIDGEERPFYEDEKESGDDSNDDESSGESANEGTEKKSIGTQEKRPKSKTKVAMDPDHRLLLKNARPLLQSRNSAVVMAVAQLYYHVAPKSEVNIVVKALIRLLRSHTEVQAVVLSCIAAMSTVRQSLFEPYMKSFYVRSGDPTQIKLLKLEILTNIANEANIPPILREFQTYISSQDKEFVAATIQSIGRCASNIKQVAETCLNGLVSLLSHPDPSVVGGAVVVAKTLLQSQRSGTKPVIAQLAKMVDRVTVPPARAAILWLLGEHCERLPKLPPDVLRKMAKTFSDEEDIVKLQILNLAAKLQLTNSAQTSLLCQYILNLAKYDQSYDIRDRARFIRHLLFPEKPDSKLSKYAKKILLSSKPAPVLQSKFKDRENFQLGSLSHFLNIRATGYQDLPPYPEVPPDPSVRDVEVPVQSPSKNDFDLFTGKQETKEGSKKTKSFYSESEESKDSDSDSTGSESSGSDSESSKSDSEESESSEDSGTEKQTKQKQKTKISNINNVDNAKAKKVIHYNSDSDASNSESDSSSMEESDSDSDENTSNRKEITNKSKTMHKPANNTNVDLLLDIGDDNSGSVAVLPEKSAVVSREVMQLSKETPKTSGFDTIETAAAMHIPKNRVEIISKLVSGGLSVSYRFTRSPNLFSPSMLSLEVHAENSSKATIKNFHINIKLLPAGMAVHPFPMVENIEPGKDAVVPLGIDFQDTTQAAKLEFSWNTEVESKSHTITISAPIGEIIRAVIISESRFITEQGKLRGMNEHEGKTFINKTFALTSGRQSLVQRVYEAANLLQVPSVEDNLVRFAGQSVSSKTLVLVTIHLPEPSGTNTSEENSISTRIVVNCEKIVIGSMLLQELKEALK